MTADEQAEAAEGADQAPDVSQGSEALDEDRLGRDDPWDTAYDPPDGWAESDRTGVTGAEQREGESLSERLAEEEPEVGHETGGQAPRPESTPSE